MDVRINAKATRVMVDTGATHNFIADVEVRRLGLRLEKDSIKMKAFNSEARPMREIAKGVELKVREWKGFNNLIATLINDFKVILGMDFLSLA